MAFNQLLAARCCSTRAIKSDARTPRFNVVVSKKALLQSLPIVGAVTGAAVNIAFTDHFNTVARCHFGIRNLERQFGGKAVQDAYQGELRLLRGGLPESAATDG